MDAILCNGLAAEDVTRSSEGFSTGGNIEFERGDDAVDPVEGCGHSEKKFSAYLDNIRKRETNEV